MKHLHTFENFLNEARALRVTVDAKLWDGHKPFIKKDTYETSYNIVSDLLTTMQGWDAGGMDSSFGTNTIVFTAIQSKGEDDLWFKIGAAGIPHNGKDEDARVMKTFGANVQVTAEELNADPKAVATKVAAVFLNAKQSMNMNFDIVGQRGIFKISPDIEKTILELVEFAIKNMKS